jgi:hypothetical protein
MSYEATDTYLKLNLVVAYAVYISMLFAFAYQSMGLSTDVSLATNSGITSGL